VVRGAGGVVRGAGGVVACGWVLTQSFKEMQKPRKLDSGDHCIGGWGVECSQHFRQPGNRFVSFVRACVRSNAIGECCWHRGGLKFSAMLAFPFPFWAQQLFLFPL